MDFGQQGCLDSRPTGGFCQLRGGSESGSSSFRNSEGKVSGKRISPAERFGERPPIDELEFPSRLGGALSPQEPIFGRRKQPRNTRGLGCVALNFSGEPRLDRQNVRCCPNLPSASQLGCRVGQPSGMSPLPRGHNDGTALTEDLVELGWKPNQNR